MILSSLFIEPLTGRLLSGLLLAMGVALILKLVRMKSLSARQRNVKILLNTLLFLLAVLFLLQPVWPVQQGDGTLLVRDAGIPAEVTDSVQAARGIKRVISYKEFKKKFAQYGSYKLFFLGQEAEPQLLSRLTGSEVEWIPYFRPGTLQEIHWQGMVQQGERQTVTGKISLTDPAKIRLVYGEKTLDSLSLQKGFNAFQLSFPVFAEGRNSVSLQLEKQPLQDIPFYAQPARPLNIALLIDNPDFESRILAEWLGARSHRVEISTPVAQSALYESYVNKASGKTTADLVIATPAHAADTRVKKAISEGKSVLFFGLENLPDALSRINRATGAAFSAQRTSALESLPLKNGLTAFPFTLNARPNQRQVGEWPVFFQKNGGLVAVSLLNETFPARLSGDTLTYSEVWTAVMAALRNADSTKVRVPAPVFRAVPVEITRLSAESRMTPANDTLYLGESPVNPLKKSGTYTFADTGWITLGPAGEVYVEDSSLAAAERWKAWLKANTPEGPAAPRGQPLAAAVWYLAFLTCLAALWIETKFRY